MPVDNIQKDYNLSREAAGRLLKVSVRTLDRYIKTKKVSTTVIDGRIWLNKEELSQFKDEKNKKVIVDNVDMSTSKMSTHVYVDRVDNSIDKVGSEVDKIDITTESSSGDFADILTTPQVNLKSHDREINLVYKSLYNELKQEVSEKQERLEIANYRVGQLENQLKNSVPLLEYHRENYEKQKHEAQLKNKLQDSLNLIKTLYQKIKYQKFYRRLLVIILLIILALQPLWLLYRYF